MKDLTRRRRHLVSALIVAGTLLIAGPASIGPASAAVHRETRYSEMCRFDWSRGTWQLRQLIKCAARRWKVPGGPDKALSVARCESRFNPKAYNSGGFAGVFQQATYYWPGRARVYGFRDWSVFNGRANIIVSIRMAHREGWAPWACA